MVSVFIHLKVHYWNEGQRLIGYNRATNRIRRQKYIAHRILVLLYAMTVDQKDNELEYNMSNNYAYFIDNSTIIVIRESALWVPKGTQ